MNWIAANTTLKEQGIELIPLEEVHFEELHLLAQDPRIWEFTSVDMETHQRRHDHFSQALFERQQGSQFPFVIVHKKDQKLIGSTRLMELNPNHKTVEIGWTWLIPDYWATEVNFACKLALLRFCFEELQTIRVQLKADSRNLRSRKAIEKIGGKFEGILRNHSVRDNGTLRDSAYFSLIHTEWKTAKANLQQLIQNKLNNNERES